MEPEFIFRDTAFIHGLTEADIRHAFETCRYVGQYQNRTNVLLLLGFEKYCIMNLRIMALTCFTEPSQKKF